MRLSLPPSGNPRITRLPLVSYLILNSSLVPVGGILQSSEDTMGLTLSGKVGDARVASWYDGIADWRESCLEEEGVGRNSAAFGEDSKPDGADPGSFAESNSEFRTGLAEHSAAHRTPGPSHSCFEVPRFQKGQTVLADAPVSRGKEARLSCVAIRRRALMLVHKRNHV